MAGKLPNDLNPDYTEERDIKKSDEQAKFIDFSRLAALELAVQYLASLVFVSGAGDDATPTDLVVGNKIHTPKKKDDENKSLLKGTLKKYYGGKTQLLDPSEDPTASVNMDQDTARITGVPSLSGQGPVRRPGIGHAKGTSQTPTTQKDTEAKKKFIPKGQ